MDYMLLQSDTKQALTRIKYHMSAIDIIIGGGGCAENSVAFHFGEIQALNKLMPRAERLPAFVVTTADNDDHLTASQKWVDEHVYGRTGKGAKR